MTVNLFSEIEHDFALIFPMSLGVGETVTACSVILLSFFFPGRSSVALLVLGLPERSGGLWIHFSPDSLHRRQASLPLRMHRCLRLWHLSQDCLKFKVSQNNMTAGSHIIVLTPISFSLLLE